MPRPLRRSPDDSATVRSLGGGVREGAYITDPSGRILECDPAFLAMFGVSSREDLGRYSVYDLMVEPSLRDREVELITRDGAVREFEMQIRLPDGRLRTVLDTCAAVPEGERGGVVFHGILVDITERKAAEEALKASEERLRHVVSSAPIIVFATDERGVVTLSEGRGLAGLGLAPGQQVGLDIRALYGGDPRIAQLIEKVLVRGETVHEIVAVRGVTFDVHGAPILASDGRVVGASGVAIDLSEQVRSAEALRASEERYALAVQGANDGLWDWDVTDDRMFLSPRWLRIVGLGADDTTAHSDDWFSRVHPDDLPQLRWALQTHFTGGSPLFEFEHRLRHRDGSWRWVLSRGVAVRDAEGNATRMAGSLTDITERKLAERQLMHDAFHDALTQLPNRALFGDLLARAVRRLRRQDDYLFAVLFLDLDRFKVVNDSLGHSLGDDLLIGVARRIERCVRPGDTVARLGGDEFTVLLDGIRGPQDAYQVADRILREVSLPFRLGGKEVFTTASIGIALSGSGYERAEDLIRDADLAMYRAKSLGKARSEVFDHELHRSAVRLLEMETDIRRALDRGEFRVHFQPIVGVESGLVEGFEALVRWQHPLRGLVPPAEFIPLAEETGLIVPLGRWVLGEACRTARRLGDRYPSDPPLSVAVNLSALQFRQPDLVDQVRETLEQTGLPAGRLRLEITESTVMERAEPSVALLSDLRSLGVQLHLDDFGTGYSSLGYLPRFAVDTLKIDRSFVGGMGRTGESAEIVGTILALARNLGLEVIAEGVETAEQLAMLRELRCGHVQGYLFSRPLDADAAAAYLESRTG